MFFCWTVALKVKLKRSAWLSQQLSASHALNPFLFYNKQCPCAMFELHHSFTIIFSLLHVHAGVFLCLCTQRAGANLSENCMHKANTHRASGRSSNWYIQKMWFVINDPQSSELQGINCKIMILSLTLPLLHIQILNASSCRLTFDRKLWGFLCTTSKKRGRTLTSDPYLLKLTPPLHKGTPTSSLPHVNNILANTRECWTICRLSHVILTDQTQYTILFYSCSVPFIQFFYTGFGNVSLLFQCELKYWTAVTKNQATAMTFHTKKQPQTNHSTNLKVLWMLFKDLKKKQTKCITCCLVLKLQTNKCSSITSNIWAQRGYSPM